MDFEDNEAQCKMYLMDEVAKIARQAFTQGFGFGIIVGSCSVLAIYFLWRLVL